MVSQKKNKIVFAILLFLVITIPVTIFVLQQQQNTRSKATAATTLSLTPNTANVTNGETVSMDVMVNPGTNSVTFIKLKINYDPTVFELSPTTPFARNVDAFPVSVEGPFVGSGTFSQSLSIGSDPTKAISTATKVGTLTFKTLKSTNNQTSNVSFEDGTLVLSLGANDQPTENVLSTTVPASVVVADSVTATATPTAAASPTPTNTLSPTSIPTNTPTATATPTGLPSAIPTITVTSGPTATPSPTLIATAVPTPTNTPTPTPAIRFNVNVLLHSIGSAGDNANPTQNSLSNKNPKRTTRAITVFLYNASNVLVHTLPGEIIYNSVTGKYSGVANAVSVLSGTYTATIKTDQHLATKVPGILTHTGGGISTLNQVSLVAGDANNDNKLSILDYNLLMDCYSDESSAPACDTNKKLATDFNDDGISNFVDYNLFLREISNQAGD